MGIAARREQKLDRSSLLGGPVGRTKHRYRVANLEPEWQNVSGLTLDEVGAMGAEVKKAWDMYRGGVLVRW